MSEKQEHKKRYNLRLQYIAEFVKWLNEEPPYWAVFRRTAWKKRRPVWKEAEE